MRRPFTFRSVAVATAALLLIPLASTAQAAPGDPGPGVESAADCHEVAIDVAPGLPTPAGQQVVGDLCMPEGKSPAVLQVLVHGGTYDATYWDFPWEDDRYSYAAAMNEAGYATLAIDLLGVGRSTHPPSALVTIQNQAAAVHDVITAARNGDFGPAFDSVVLVGHSLGTLTVYVETSMYGDADGVVATGTSHAPGLLGLANIFAGVTPAVLDPVIAPQIPFGDVGYLSTPGARKHFYAGGDVDPVLLEQDEQNRQPVTAGHALTLLPYLLATGLLDTRSIDVPVLLANGSADSVFCRQGGGLAGTDCADSEALMQAEGRYFSPEANLETFVLPNSGHNLNLVPHADQWFDRAEEWFTTHFPLEEPPETPPAAAATMSSGAASIGSDPSMHLLDETPVGPASVEDAAGTSVQATTSGRLDSLLPSTGAMASTAWLVLLGVILLLGGTAIAMRRPRPEAHIAAMVRERLAAKP